MDKSRIIVGEVVSVVLMCVVPAFILYFAATRRGSLIADAVDAVAAFLGWSRDTSEAGLVARYLRSAAFLLLLGFIVIAGNWCAGFPERMGG